VGTSVASSVGLAGGVVALVGTRGVEETDGE